MKHYFFLIVCIFSIIQIQSQTLRGQVIDEDTQDPIPFANISIGNNYGVISNDEGFFIIQLRNTDADKSLLISSLGHEEISIPIKDFKENQVIALKLANEQLDEVIVSNQQLTAYEIVTKFLENKKENHHLRNTKTQIFHRNNNDYESVDFKIDLKRVSYLNKKEKKKFNEGMERIQQKLQGATTSDYQEKLSETYILKDTLVNQHIKSMYLINRNKSIDSDEIMQDVMFEIIKSLESENTFKVKSGIFPLDKDLDLNEFIEEYEAKKEGNPIPDTLKFENKSLSLSYIEKNKVFEHEFFTNEKRYEYELEGYAFAHGHTCYHIKFRPDRNKAKYEGEMFIDAKDFGMVAFNYRLIEGKKTNNINLKLVLGIKVNTFEDSGDYVFSRSDDGYFAKYIRLNDSSYMYFDLSLSFKENNVRRRDRKSVKFNLLLEQIIHSKEEYVAIEHQSINSDLKESLNFDGYILIDELNKYDPMYWDGYNIIEATQAIKSYE